MAEETIAPYRHAAKWTPDCQGKQDFDGPVVSISTRYWPAGGGFSMLDIRTGEWTEGKEGIKPSATSSIILDLAEGDYRILASVEFEGETESIVKAQVEAWADEQFAKIEAAMTSLFGR